MVRPLRSPLSARGGFAHTWWLVMFPTIKRFFCAAGVSFLLAPSLHAATYPLAVSHATLGPSPVTFTLVEADGLNSGGSPGNTTRMVNASQFFSGSGFAAGSGLWQWRDFAGLNLRGGPNPGGVDLLEADPARNAPNLRTTVTGLPLAAYEVWLAYMTRNEGGELPQLLVDIETVYCSPFFDGCEGIPLEILTDATDHTDVNFTMFEVSEDCDLETELAMVLAMVKTKIN